MSTPRTLRHHLPSGGEVQGETRIDKETYRQMDIIGQTDRPVGKDTNHISVSGLDIYSMVTVDHCWSCD